MSRRRLLGGLGMLGLALVGCGSLPFLGRRNSPITLYTFGDSILDCGSYNPYGITPGQLLVKNDDALFPEFRGRDLSSRRPAKLDHRATGGATVGSLPGQARGLRVEGDALAILTIGGNDLLGGLLTDPGPGIEAFGRSLEVFLQGLPIRPVLIGNVYDPTFGDDSRNFLDVDPGPARANHRRMNQLLAALGGRYGRPVDLHGHFLKGDPSWFTNTIEPSLTGASEVRRVFLQTIGSL